MRNIVLAAIAVITLGLGFIIFSGTNAAYAASCQGAHTPTACGAAGAAASAGAYKGPVAPTTEPMVCIHVLADRPTEVVLVKGRPSLMTPLSGLSPLLRWRPEAINWRPWARDGRYMVGEICLPARLMSQYSFVTFCNGHTPGDGNHSVFDQTVQSYVLRQKRVGENDPVCLLGTFTCGQYGL